MVLKLWWPVAPFQRLSNNCGFLLRILPESQVKTERNDHHFETTRRYLPVNSPWRPEAPLRKYPYSVHTTNHKLIFILQKLVQTFYVNLKSRNKNAALNMLFIF